MIEYCRDNNAYTGIDYVSDEIQEKFLKAVDESYPEIDTDSEDDGLIWGETNENGEFSTDDVSGFAMIEGGAWNTEE